VIRAAVIAIQIAMLPSISWVAHALTAFAPLIDGTDIGMRPFIAFISKLPDARFCALFPDLPGCSATGATITEALHGAEGALAAYCQRLHDKDRPVPSPTLMHELGPDRPTGLVALVRPRTTPGRRHDRSDPPGLRRGCRRVYALLRRFRSASSQAVSAWKSGT